ncbi:hypothetical protein [Dehalogenimonas sp. 4OHTPN]|uniref:Uncharacterized protein n=1 Tax=Dehalogenimonas sp. 4OHTPN TaxID=3166643 RepID=A0AAU8G929_9CHLR
MKKLAVLQIILGVIILVFGGIAVGGTFSTQFSYPGGLHGEPDLAVFQPEALKVARWAGAAVLPLGLGVIVCGIAQLRRS